MIVKGYRCPYCKGPITAFTRPVRDPHSEDGWSEMRYKITVRSRDMISPADKKVTRVVKGADYQGTAVAEYEHTLAGYCNRCSMGYAVDQMQLGEPIIGTEKEAARSLPAQGAGEVVLTDTKPQE